MRSKYGQYIIAIVIFSAAAAFSGDTTTNYTPKISGYSSFEAGEVMKGYSDAAGMLSQGPINHAWLETGYIGLCADAAINDRLRVLVGGEAQLLFSFRRTHTGENGLYNPEMEPQTNFIIKRGEALYTIGSAAHPLFQIEAGFFPYKYDPDATNLGEFLFRSYCYPSSIVASFDKPYADLAGFRIGNSFAIGQEFFHQDLLLTTETSLWPFEDFSLSYLADYSAPGLFSLGAGVQFFDLFSVGVDDPEQGDATTPDISPNGTFYTFAGTKVMGRLSFDMKGLFPPSVSGMFGREDLKLYGEAAILGLKNYKDSAAQSAYYDSLLWRLPVMIGFNVPTFRLLDVLSFELEYQDSPYPNSTENVFYDQEPTHWGPMQERRVSMRNTSGLYMREKALVSMLISSGKSPATILRPQPRSRITTMQILPM